MYVYYISNGQDRFLESDLKKEKLLHMKYKEFSFLGNINLGVYERGKKSTSLGFKFGKVNS